MTARHLQDGGQDAYDKGNFISIGDCTLRAYSDGFSERSACGEVYAMSLRPHSFTIISTVRAESVHWGISGNLGADQHGRVHTANYTGHDVWGLRKSVCQADNDPGVHHLWITDDSMAPYNWVSGSRTESGGTDLDQDIVILHASFSLVLIVYWSSPGTCLSDRTHEAIFHGSTPLLAACAATCPEFVLPQDKQDMYRLLPGENRFSPLSLRVLVLSCIVYCISSYTCSVCSFFVSHTFLCPGYLM